MSRIRIVYFRKKKEYTPAKIVEYYMKHATAISPRPMAPLIQSHHHR